MSDYDFDENGIIGAWALRIDGYKYQDMDFDFHRVVDDFYRTGRFEVSDLEKLVTLFFMQRSFKWGGQDYAPTNGKFWRAYRTLFLETYALEVPEELRLMDFYGKWQTGYAPETTKLVAIVRDIHATTRYDDDAPPDLTGFEILEPPPKRKRSS